MSNGFKLSQIEPIISDESHYKYNVIFCFIFHLSCCIVGGGGGVGSNVMHTQNGLCMFLLVIIQILVFLPLELAHPLSSPIYFKMRIIAVYVLM